MKKKKIIILIAIIVLIIALIGAVLAAIRVKKDKYTNEYRIKKGYEIFGDEYCSGHNRFESAGQALTPWTCKICGYHDVNSNTNVPTICVECANITSRCMECGKLEIGYKTICKENGYDYNKIISNYEDYTKFVSYTNAVNKAHDEIFKYDSSKYNKEFFETKSLAVISIHDISSLDTINLSIDNDTLIYNVLSEFKMKEIQNQSRIILVEIDKNITNLRSKY